MSKLKESLIDQIKEYFANNGDEHTPAIIGISGGKDSTVAAALLCEALGKDRVIGILMPNGVQSDIRDAREVADSLGIFSYEINIEKMYKAFLEIFDEKLFPMPDAALFNVPPRIRMTVLYAIAQKFGGRVCGTSNMSETTIGYFTKWGDGAADFKPLADLTATEVMALGEELGLPDHLSYKVPADGLTGKSDEDNFGFSYKELDDWILRLKTPSAEKLSRMVKKRNAAKHKNIRTPWFCVKPEDRINFHNEHSDTLGKWPEDQKYDYEF